MSSDYMSSVLDVECNGRQAHLYLHELSQATKNSRWCKDPCIAIEDDWVTPNKFVNMCGLAKSRPAWKLAVYHHGTTMKTLMEDGIVTLDPPGCKCSFCVAEKSTNKMSSSSENSQKNNNNCSPVSEPQLPEVTSLYVCNKCDLQFETKRGYTEHRSSELHGSALLHSPSGQVVIDLSGPKGNNRTSPAPNRDDYSGIEFVDIEVFASPKRGSGPYTPATPKAPSVRRATRAATTATASTSQTLEPTSSTTASPNGEMEKQEESSSSAQQNKTSSPAPKQKKRKSEDDMSITSASSTAEPSNKLVPVTVKGDLSTPLTLDMLNVYSTEDLISELERRKVTFTCGCGVLFYDRALFYLHKTLHSVNDPRTCGLCGYRATNWYDFNTHFFDHSNPQHRLTIKP